MRFVLFVEGHTETRALPGFLKRWLDSKLESRVGIQPVLFNGWAEYVEEVARKARLYLHGSGHQNVIAVIGLLDLYGPTIYPMGVESTSDRIGWATKHLEDKVQQDRFRQFFAVHETEAWLLSQPQLFPSEVAKPLLKNAKDPEVVDFDEPPSQLLQRLYIQKTKRPYKEVVYGRNLFEKLDPAVAYDKCPNLKRLLDEMTMLAKGVGL